MELDYKRIVVTFLMHLGHVILTTPFLEVPPVHRGGCVSMYRWRAKCVVIDVYTAAPPTS